MASMCRTRRAECVACNPRRQKDPTDDDPDTRRGGGGGDAGRGRQNPLPPDFSDSDYFRAITDQLGGRAPAAPMVALAPGQNPVPASAPAPQQGPEPTSAAAPAPAADPVVAAQQKRIRALVQQIHAMERAQQTGPAAGTGGRRRGTPVRPGPHFVAGDTNRFLYDSMIFLLPAFVRRTAEDSVREATARKDNAGADMFAKTAASKDVKAAKSQWNAAIKFFGPAPTDGAALKVAAAKKGSSNASRCGGGGGGHIASERTPEPTTHATKRKETKKRPVPGNLAPTDLTRRIKYARRTNPNAQHEEQERTNVDLTFALCDVACTIASQVGLRQPAARKEALGASTKEQRDRMNHVFYEKVAGDNDENEEGDGGDDGDGDDDEGDEDEGDEDEDQEDDAPTAEKAAKARAREHTPTPGKHLEGIGMLRSLYFVTHLRSLAVRKRVANHASKIIAECTAIAHTTQLDVMSNEQHDLTELVPQLLQDVYAEMKTSHATWFHTSYSAARIRKQLLARADKALNPDALNPRPWPATPASRRWLAFADSRVLFWACVVLGGCSPENKASWETMSKNTPFVPTPASHIWSKHFKLVHIPGPPPQVFTSTRYFATSSFYGAAKAPGEDNDGFFIPPGGAPPPWLTRLHKVYNKNGRCMEVRDYGYDGVEQAGRQELPVRTADVMRAATTASRPPAVAGVCAYCGLISTEHGGDPSVHGMDMCSDRAVCSVELAKLAADPRVDEDLQPEPSLLQEYLALATPPAAASAGNIYECGVELKRSIQRSNPLTQLEPAGADSRGRPVCHVSFAAGFWPWRTRTNALAQLVNGYAFPSLLSTAEVKKWEAQYCGIVYYKPSVYVPSKVLRQLHEQAFLYGLKDASIRDRRTGRGLFAVYDAAPDQRPRELPLLPSWWRKHKTDLLLIAEHGKFKERGDPAATSRPCIWHQWSPADTGRRKNPTQPESCGVDCADLGELYSHRCRSREAPGGDVYSLVAQIGITMEKGHVESASRDAAKAAGLAPPAEAPHQWWARELWNFWGPTVHVARGGSGGSGARHNNTPLAAGVGRRSTATQDPNVSIADASDTSDDNDNLTGEDLPTTTPLEEQPSAQPSQAGPQRNKRPRRGEGEVAATGRKKQRARKNVTPRATTLTVADVNHAFRPY